MKIALVNYRYFVSGGPERYMFNIKEILELNGHEVVPFSIKHNKNIKNDFENYFLDPIGTGEEVYSHEYPKNIKTTVNAVGRMLYSLEAKRKFKKFLIEIQPDIIYILQFQNKLSCSIIDAAKELQIPVVQRISDFGHICPNAHFYRSDIGICEQCTTKNLLQAVKNKCISDSYSHSALKALSLGIMSLNKTREKIDAFIFPSSFTMKKYITNGFNVNKSHHIPTFFHNPKMRKIEDINYGDFALYIGRIEKEKGIDTMIKAFLKTKRKLKIIGFSNGNYIEEMIKLIEGRENQIEFLGKLDFDDVTPYLENCLFTVVPSEWYENFPNTVLESFAFKKAVLATHVGSLPEIVTNNNGFCYDYGSSNSLKDKIETLFTDVEIAKKKGVNGYNLLNSRFSSDMHYSDLINVFRQLCLSKDKKTLEYN